MKIHTIGGYEKVGANMTAVESEGEIVIFDMGADIERIVKRNENLEEMKTVEAIESKIVPNDYKLKKRREDVKAIVVNHGHQDHCRGLPKLAGAYDCPIIATPYTADLIERFIKSDVENVRNKIIRMGPGDTYQVSGNIELEFENITHSIPQSVISVLRTGEGNIIYSLDFKLDRNPTLGDPVDYEKVEELGKEGVRVYIVDCTRANEPGKTKSERETKIELREILSEACENRRGIIITTFSSNIARLNNIIEACDGNREIVFLGRSLKEYTRDAEKRGLIDLSDIEIGSYREKVKEILKKSAENKSDFILVTTGNQGEPNATLSRIADENYDYIVKEGDMVVFSSVAIPTKVNQLNRRLIERKLSKRGAKVITNVHSHGHAKKEDHRDMMKMLTPKTVIPAHGDTEKLVSCAQLAREEKIDSVRISSNGGQISLS